MNEEFKNILTMSNRAQLDNITPQLAAHTTALANIGNASPKGVYATTALLTAAFPAGNSNIYVVTGNVADIAKLVVTAPCTTGGNVTVTLNGVAVNVAVLTSDTAIQVADKIRAATFTGWTTGGTVGTTTVIFTCNTTGVKTDAVFATASTGVTGTMTTTTQGVDADGKWYYWNGTAWISGGVYQSTGIAEKSINATHLSTGASKGFSFLDSPLAYDSNSIINTTYSIGAINGSGATVTQVQKIVSDFFQATEDITIKFLKSGYNCALFIYDATKSTLISNIQYPSDIKITYNPNYYYRTVISKTVLANVTDIAEYANAVCIAIGINKISQAIKDNAVATSKHEKRFSIGNIPDCLMFSFELGALNTVGALATHLQKIRSIDYFQVTENFTISFLKSGFSCMLFVFDATKTIVSYTIYSVDTTITFNPTYYYKLTIFKVALENVVTIAEYEKSVALVIGTVKLKPYIGEKIMFIGDSITYQPNGWVSVFNEIIKPLSFVNTAVPGATWCDKAGTIYDGNPVSDGVDANVNNTIGNQVQKILNNNYAAPDIIIIAAGTNDNIDSTVVETQFVSGGSYIPLGSVDRKTFPGAMRYVVETLLNKYPNAQIYITTPIQSAEAKHAWATTKLKATSIKTVADRLALPVFDAFSESGIYGAYEVADVNGKYLHDGLHTSTTLETSAVVGCGNGATKLGKYFANKLISVWGS